jgi:hypothetical protein
MTSILSKILGLYPSSGILLEHNVSEIESVSVLRLRGGGETPTQLGPLEKANLHHWTKSKNPIYAPSSEPFRIW